MILKLWKTNPSREARKSLSVFSESDAIGVPATSTAPQSGRSMHPMRLSSVVLPLPEAPAMAVTAVAANLKIDAAQGRHFYASGAIGFEGLLEFRSLHPSGLRRVSQGAKVGMNRRRREIMRRDAPGRDEAFRERVRRLVTHAMLASYRAAAHREPGSRRSRAVFYKRLLRSDDVCAAAPHQGPNY